MDWRKWRFELEEGKLFELPAELGGVFIFATYRGELL
jgi:hypothetical protein